MTSYGIFVRRFGVSSPHLAKGSYSKGNHFDLQSQTLPKSRLRMVWMGGTLPRHVLTAVHCLNANHYFCHCGLNDCEKLRSTPSLDMDHFQSVIHKEQYELDSMIKRPYLFAHCIV